MIVVFKDCQGLSKFVKDDKDCQGWSRMTRIVKDCQGLSRMASQHQVNIVRLRIVKDEIKLRMSFIFVFFVGKKPKMTT